MRTLLISWMILVEVISDSSISNPTWFDPNQAEKHLLETGVSDLDVLMNFLKPEMVKRLTENEESVVSKLEIDVGEAEKDLVEIRDKSSSILSILENLENGANDEQDPDTFHKLRESVHNLVSQMHKSLEHLNVAKIHLETHEQELRHVHAEIFATELAANVYGLVKGVEGIDYSTGDVKLTIDGTEKESLRNLKEKLIQSLITERDKTEGLVQKLTDPAVMQLKFDFLVDLCVMIIASSLGGVMASFIRVPPLVGHILGGFMIGPSGFHLIQDIASAHTVAQLGSVFVLFRKGIRFPLDGLDSQSSTKGLEIGAAITFLVVSGLAVMSAMSGAASTSSESIMFGVAMCISSASMVTTLMSRHSSTQTYVAFAKRLLAIGSINELMMGIVLALPVALAGGLEVSVRILFTVVVFGLASVSFRSHLAPSAFNYIVSRPGLNPNALRALVFLSTVSWCLLFAISTDILGLSIECGAFASGIYLAGMSNVHDISEMLNAVSVLMGAIYFASVGMILNIDWTFDHAWSVLSITLMVTTVKILVAMLILVYTAQLSFRSALLAGVALSQIGDISLVYVSKAHRLELIGRNLYLHMLVSIVIMMIVLPILLRYLFQRLSSSLVATDGIQCQKNSSEGNRISSLIEMGETNKNRNSSTLPSTSGENGGDLHEL